MKTLKLALLTFCLIGFYVANAQSKSYTFSENNNHVQAIQQEGGKSKTKGDVKIEFYGHMAFKITSPKGLTIMIDPWRNDPTGTFGVWYPGEFPEVAVDIAMSSHAHFDHDAIYRTHATMNLERMAGEFKLGDVEITGVADNHQCKAPGEINWSAYLAKEFNLTNICDDDRAMNWDNVFYRIETGGLKIGFWGDNNPNPNKKVREALKGLDILIMNIDDSGHILNAGQIKNIIDTYSPKAVIPGHYLVEGAELESSSLKSADNWVDAQEDVVKLNTAEMDFNYTMLKKAKKRVYYFGNNYKKD